MICFTLPTLHATTTRIAKCTSKTFKPTFILSNSLIMVKLQKNYIKTCAMKIQHFARVSVNPTLFQFMYFIYRYTYPDKIDERK